MSFQKKKNNQEILKWVLVIFLLTFLVTESFFLQNVNFFLQNVINVFIIIFLISIVLITEKGKIVIAFVKSTKLELYRIIWPSFQETLYTTIIVFSVTSVLSLFLWGLDSILVRIVSFLTGLRF